MNCEWISHFLFEKCQPRVAREHVRLKTVVYTHRESTTYSIHVKHSDMYRNIITMRSIVKTVV